MQSRDGRPKKKGDGIVAGLRKVRHVNVVGSEGNCCYEAEKVWPPTMEKKSKLVKIKGVWDRYAMSSVRSQMNWPEVQGGPGEQGGLARIPCLSCRSVATDVDVEVVAGCF